MSLYRAYMYQFVIKALSKQRQPLISEKRLINLEGFVFKEVNCENMHYMYTDKITKFKVLLYVKTVSNTKLVNNDVSMSEIGISRLVP